MMFSFEDYKKNSRSFNLEEPCDFFFYRPFAYLIVKLTYGIPLTPNHFSFLSFLSSLFSGYQFTLGTKQGYFLGGLGILIFGIFDCCDGMLARLKQNGSKFGELIDMFVDLMANISIFTGLFIGISKNVNLSYPPNIIFLAGVFLFIHASIYHYFKKQYFFYLNENPEGRTRQIVAFKREYDLLKSNKGSIFSRLLLKLYLIYAGLQKDSSKQAKYDVENYAFLNNHILPLWGPITGSTHLTVMAVSLMLGTVDYYICYALVFSNIWMALVSFVQHSVNSRIKVIN